MGWLDLHHYYERDLGSFQNLCDLVVEEADVVMRRLRERGDVFASQSSTDFLRVRWGSKSGRGSYSPARAAAR